VTARITHFCGVEPTPTATPAPTPELTPTSAPTPEVTSTATPAPTLSPVSSDAEFYLRRAQTSFQNYDYDKAISDYTEAISLNPNFAFAYDNRGLALLKQGNIGLFRQSETPWLHWAGVSVGYEHLGLFARCPTL